MKARQASEVERLDQIPNVGPAVLKDLAALGISKPAHLRGKDGIELYHQLNRATGVRHDPCMADTFMAIVDFMNGGSPKPWWEFTAERKRLFLRSNGGGRHEAGDQSR